ncbi:MAG: AAA family ATPase [Sphingopyxis sp.]|jgi:predicted ATPase|nr:AAA family ATPase [Sphingopyxis sp.]
MVKPARTKLPPPWLKRIWIKDDLVADRSAYPFTMPIFGEYDFSCEFSSPITIFVGENGAGKSTLLEAIAGIAGFGALGGNRDHEILQTNPWDEDSALDLHQVMGASWLPKLPRGFFFRAESFFGLARYMEQSAYEAARLGPAFLSQSHGEGFMSVFFERCAQQGLYIFDEPESALSPDRQLEFIKFVVQQTATGNMQAIIATHSPLIMAMPGSDLRQIDHHGMRSIALEDTAHFRLYREFALYPHETISTFIDS